MKKTTFWKCVICGKVTAGRMLKDGDGSLIFPRRHKVDGKACEGNIIEAECIEKPREGKYIW